MTDPPSQPPTVPPSSTPISEGTGQPVLPPTEGAPTDPVTTASTPAATRGSVPPAPGFTKGGRVRASKVSGVWVGMIAAALFLILLVIFVAQNSRKVPLHFFGWHGNFSLALTILLSAVIGLLLVAIPGTIRIVQLRKALRKNGPHPR